MRFAKLFSCACAIAMIAVACGGDDDDGTKKSDAGTGAKSSGGTGAGGKGGSGGTGGTSPSGGTGGSAGSLSGGGTAGATSGGAGGSAGSPSGGSAGTSTIDAGDANDDVSSGGTSPDGAIEAASDATADSDAKACLLCSAMLSKANPAALCKNNGPPTSYQLGLAVLNCMCNSSCGTGACLATCTNFTVPTNACFQCTGEQCPNEVGACVADDGSPKEGGTSGDSGPSDGAPG